MIVEFAFKYLHDDGVIVIFYPDSYTIKKEIKSYTSNFNLKVTLEWNVLNSLPMCSPSNPAKATFISKAIVLVRSLPSNCLRQPANLIIKQDQFSPGVDLNNHDMLLNALDDSSLLRKNTDGKPWRGPKQRTELFFKPLIYEMCPDNGTVLDFGASTSASVQAALSLNRSILALEGEKSIYTEVLVALTIPTLPLPGTPTTLSPPVIETIHQSKTHDVVDFFSECLQHFIQASQ